MNNPFIVGEQIYLRALEEEDLEGDYLKWLNDPEINIYMTAGLIPQNKRMLKAFYDSVNADPNSVYFAIVDKKSNKHIGNIKLDKIDWINRRCEFGILIGDKNFWGKGICKKATKLIVEYGFTKLNLRKICIGVIEENKAALNCYKSVGFKEEGNQREMHHDHTKQKYVGHILLGLLRKEYFKNSK